MINKNLAEIMYEVRDAKSPEEQANILKKYNNAPLFFLLKISFSTNYKKIEKEPEYVVDDSPIGYSYMTLTKTYRNIPALLTQAAAPHLQKKQEEKFKLLLESLHWTESALLVNLLMKKIPEIYNLTLETLKTYFPGEFNNVR
ncbi:MAG: hypothetical protein EB127_11530 [Alphaproteobacteria bacterium]|nr:hypothetical protein [Alphaproteobacteria bacterium]